ncbi:hypothetical protein DPMN_145774 [Dreissena polymorpha]|uniref:Uncharacterized protein n=1 Tax=Dreissena polymorpha TaxID=45954 RepID=A0A9D4F5U1_DREPO|nr:hypothetical protein DPMN_145774 [Dreissena polymorpha]
MFMVRELVRHQGSALNGTPLYVNEQFSKEAANNRFMLVPRKRRPPQQTLTSVDCVRHTVCQRGASSGLGIQRG